MTGDMNTNMIGNALDSAVREGDTAKVESLLMEHDLTGQEGLDILRRWRKSQAMVIKPHELKGLGNHDNDWK